MAGVMPEGWALPAVDRFNRAFFTSGAVVLQACAACGTVQHPPEEVCHRCLGMEFKEYPTSGAGTISSYVVAHHPVASALREAVPYTIALVSLDDLPGARVIGNVVNRPPADIAIGQKVRAVFDDTHQSEDGEILRIPQWEVID